MKSRGEHPTKSALRGSQSPVPATKSAHRGSQSAVPATKPAFTKCCPCYEICTSRFTKCCTCHEICSSRFTKSRKLQTSHMSKSYDLPRLSRNQSASKITAAQSAAPATISALRSKTAPIPCTRHEKRPWTTKTRSFPCASQEK